MSESSLQHTKSPLESLFPFTLFLLAALPLAYAAILTWHEYLRLTAIAAGLSVYAWRRYQPANHALGSSSHAAALIALGLIFVTTQFDSATSARAEMIPVAPLNAAFLISSALSVIAFVFFLVSQKPWGKLNILDWAVMGAIVLVLGLSVGSHLLSGSPFPWYSSTKLVIYGLLWFTVTRWLPSAPVVERRLMRIMPMVFVAVCLVGVFRIGQAFYHYQAGEWARNAGEFHKAIAHFEDTAAMSRLLRLDALRDVAMFTKAEVLYRQGDVAGAAKTLSMEEGFVLSIPASTWEGPAGGMLYTNIGCWKDLTLYEGRIEVRIYARGVSALGIWPQMRVRLGNRLLGEVQVDSRDTQLYTFETQVGLGRQRLEVTFINDYFNPPENRDLWVEQAEIRYTKIAWR